ncbi:MAG: LysR family transcriptional regulator [Lachnospiraceae bacterium]|nr:LysR family transcriptional regulator [Candidatus Equihabitans merdae]
MELRHIRYFLEVAKEMNFTRAAENLAIAQPPLSRQIKDLEEELGVQLFIRKPHALSLTPEGEYYKEYAQQILSLVDQSTEEVREVQHGLRGTLYLASVEGYAPRLLAKWIAGFSKLHPHVQYNLWNGNSDDVVNRVYNGLADLAIIVEPHNEEKLASMTVHKESWVAIMSSKHPLAKKKAATIAMDELLPYELIIPSRASRLDEINSWFEDKNAKPIVRCRTAHFLSAFELSRENVGVTIYPEAAAVMVGAAAQQDDVCIKKIRKPNVVASYAMIWDNKRTLPHAAAAFIEYVKEQTREAGFKVPE